jgi:hypothetical protein
MKTQTTSIGMIRCSVIALAIGFTCSSFVLADEPAGNPGDVKERGVPLAPEGVILQGNQLRAAPGYVLEKGPNKQMTVRPRSGGGRSLTLDCGCQGGTGNCGLDVSGDVAICHRDSVQPCSGTCGWSSIPSKVGPPSMR